MSRNAQADTVRAAGATRAATVTARAAMVDTLAATMAMAAADTTTTVGTADLVVIQTTRDILNMVNTLTLQTTTKAIIIRKRVITISSKTNNTKHL